MTQEGPLGHQSGPQESVHWWTQRGPGSGQQLCTDRNLPEVAVPRKAELRREVN